MTTIPARSLSGDHLGKTVTFAHKLATYRGTLRAVDHSTSPFGGARPMLHIRDGEWSAVRHIDPDTPVTIEDTE